MNRPEINKTEDNDMSTDRSSRDFIKEMLIAFIGGGSLGLVVLIVVLVIVEHYK
jgi:hypothetical protein